MRNIKLTIEYDGTHFNGWQIQDPKQRTVQGEIKKALKKVFKNDLTLYGSGRTDSGVHALEQVANFKVESHLEPTAILRAVNASLPNDVAIIKVEEAKSSFHAQFDAKTKVYHYRILNRPARSAIHRDYSYHFPVKLNLKAMRQEAKALVGKKDFKSFRATPPANTKEKNTIRTIKSVTIKKKRDFVLVEIMANGFLHKMVRNIVGTLIAIGAGHKKSGHIKEILRAKNRSFAGKTAHPKGLCLVKVNY